MKKRRLFDYAKLRGRIRERYQTQNALARVLGLSGARFSLKLNNAAEFTQGEIDALCEYLEIEAGDIGAFFLTPKVQQMVTSAEVSV